MLRSELAAAALSLLAGTAHAQLPPYAGPPRTIDLSPALEGLPPGVHFREVAAGDLDGDLDGDVVYQVEGDVVVCLDVATSTSCFRLERAANDLLVHADPPRRDALVLAQEDGLSVLAFAHDEELPLVTWTETSLELPEVADLAVLAPADLDGAGAPDLVGVRADGHTLVALLADPLAPAGFSVLPGFAPQTAGVAWDLVGGDFAPGGAAALAAVTSAGLEFFDATGQAIGMHAWSAELGAIVALSLAGARYVAWVRPVPGGTSELVLARPGEIDLVSSLGPLSVVAAACGDLDADGDQDLALALDDSSSLLLVESDAGVLDVSGARLLQSGNPPGGASAARPLVADLEGDGEQDVAWADWQSESLELFLNDEWWGYEDLLPQIIYLDLSVEDHVTWDFGPGYSHYAAPPDVTHLQVRVYNQFPSAEHGWSEPELVGPAPFGTYLMELRPYGPYLIEFPLLEPGVVADDFVTYVEARYIVARFGVTKKYPPIFFALFDEDNYAALDYLQAWFGPDVAVLRQIGNGDKDGVGELPPPPMPKTPTDP